jgi:hypothetical protein
MEWLKGRRPSPALIISVIALAVALGGTAVAASRINGSRIEKQSIGGGKIKKDTLTGFQIRNTKLGTVPTAQRATNTHWAVVNNPAGAGNAALARGSESGISVVESGGAVGVVFPVNVSGCANVAGKNNTGTAVPGPGFAQTNVSGINPNAIQVRTRDQAGMDVDGDFHLMVVCP